MDNRKKCIQAAVHLLKEVVPKYLPKRFYMKFDKLFV